LVGRGTKLRPELALAVESLGSIGGEHIQGNPLAGEQRGLRGARSSKRAAGSEEAASLKGRRRFILEQRS
jgi:hypothetical protein